MTDKFLIIIVAFLSMTFSLIGQTQKDRLQLGQEYAKKQLKIALSDTTVHNVISSKDIIIKDKETAVALIEPILFGIYGRNNIIKQRPYEIYFIDHYWIVSGTLPKEYLGGTFLIIIDATNSKVIRLTHGK